ncbi:MAG TPA: hypothetical protein VHN80_09705, partial [Kineosporiaceae bacterium]|nr:hypothetical protein [Kineosporiaceae bacterium]
GQAGRGDPAEIESAAVRRPVSEGRPVAASRLPSLVTPSRYPLRPEANGVIAPDLTVPPSETRC